MIGKQFKSSDFKSILEYVCNKSGAYSIGGNMTEKEPINLAREFEFCARKNIKKCVYHVSLSVAPSEKLSDKKWAKIGKAYLEGMGFEENQYVMYRHTDREHEHIHIIANRIKVTDGSVISDSWNYTRSEKLIRKLEKEFDLLTPNSHSLRSESIVNPQENNVKNRLKQIIKESLDESLSLDEFINSLKNQKISVRLRKSPEETIRGISYKLQGVVAFQGKQLGEEYSWKSIEKHLAKTAVTSSETPINMNTNIDSIEQKSLDNRKLDKQKKLLREKYLKLMDKLHNPEEFKDKKSKEIDLKIAILALRDKESIGEVKQLLTQSDTVIRWKEELPREEYLKASEEYIEKVINRSKSYVQKHREKEEDLVM